MKFISLLLGLFFSISGQTSECTSLFSDSNYLLLDGIKHYYKPRPEVFLPKPYDRFMPMQTATEVKLLNEYKEMMSQYDESRLVEVQLTEAEALLELQEAFRVIKSYYNAFEIIRAKEESVLEITFDESKFSAENLDRIRTVSIMVEHKITRLLTARGIKYNYVFGSPAISLKGDHYLNKIAERISDKYPLVLN